MVRWSRIVNERLNTIDFIDQETVERKLKNREKKLEKNANVEKNGGVGPIVDLDEWNPDMCVEARLVPWEKDRLVFQMGSNDPVRAIEAAKVVEKDVMGIDLNCGCPKHFSTSGGMGSALLSNPELLCSILDALVKNFPHLQISCKIRLLHKQDPEPTINLIKRIQATGVHHVTIHARTKDMKSSQDALWDMLKLIIPHLTIPINVNGDLFKANDLHKVFKVLGPHPLEGFMIARAAQFDPVVFYRMQRTLDRAGFAPVEFTNIPKVEHLPENRATALTKTQLISRYIKLSYKYASPWSNCKWQSKCMLDEIKPGDLKGTLWEWTEFANLRKRLTGCMSWKEGLTIADLFMK